MYEHGKLGISVNTSLIMALVLLVWSKNHITCIIFMVSKWRYIQHIYRINQMSSFLRIPFIKSGPICRNLTLMLIEACEFSY